MISKNCLLIKQMWSILLSDQMESLPIDVMRIILELASPNDVKNFSLTAKHHLHWLTDIQLWINFCITRTRFTRDIFLSLVEGRPSALRNCYGGHFPYSPQFTPYSLREGYNRCIDVYFCMQRVYQCNNRFKSGSYRHRKRKTCNRSTLPGAPMCLDCCKKKDKFESLFDKS